MPTVNNEREVLVIRGYLDRAGRFTLRRSRSTPFVREWPVVESREAFVELLDGEGRVLHREPAKASRVIVCEPGEIPLTRLLAYIEWRPDAVSVRLLYDGIEVWFAKIPDTPSVSVKRRRGNLAEDRRLVLNLKFSTGSEDAHLTVIYKWGEGRFRPIYIGQPREELKLDLRGMPGGDTCQVLVDYSNGLRSAQAVTDTFRVPPIGPSVSIVRPTAKDEITAGMPVIFEASVRDEERRGGAAYEDLVWYVDHKEVGRGLIASVDALAAGRRRVELEYRATPGARAVAVVSVHKIDGLQPANEWPEWDFISGNN